MQFERGGKPGNESTTQHCCRAATPAVGQGARRSSQGKRVGRIGRTGRLGRTTSEAAICRATPLGRENDLSPCDSDSIPTSLLVRRNTVQDSHDHSRIPCRPSTFRSSGHPTTSCRDKIARKPQRGLCCRCDSCKANNPPSQATHQHW